MLIVLADKLGKGEVGFLLLHGQHLVHAAARLRELYLPINELAVEVLPFLGRGGVADLRGDFLKLLAVAALRHLGHNLTLVDVLLQREKNLHRIDRFEQIVGNLRADGLVHKVLGLVLRHYHHGHIGLHVFDAGQRFET